MIKVINGIRYNTETATEIAGDGNGLCCSDFQHWCEYLYRTAKGAWFIHGQGGALSRYGVSVAGGSGGSEVIKPLTDDDARAWLMSHSGDAQSLESLEKWFGNSIVDA